MTEQHPTLATFYNGWNDYQDLLIKAITPLTADQLDLRAAPHLRSIKEIATHMIGARARWFHEWVDEGDQDFAMLGTWDRKGMPVRSAVELVNGLEITWSVMQTAIARWTPAEWDQTYEGEPGEPASFTRRWVIWHLIEHDLHHGGELSLTLGMYGLAVPDL